MTTSNTTTYAADVQTCAQLALQLINVTGEGDNLENYDYGFCKHLLNLMLKSWQNLDNHLWVKQTAYLFLQNSQNTYRISTTTTDHFTADVPRETTLSASFVLGDSTITVASSVNMTANDYIGIKMDNNYIHWTTISSIPVANTIILATPLTYASTTGNYVLNYTNALNTPFQIYSGVRRLVTSKIDTPMNMLSYREYLDLPNKDSSGTPISWSYDKQRDYFDIKIWQTPANVDYYCKFIISRKIQDVNLSNETFDIPQEMQLAVVYGLAVMAAPAYGKAEGANFQEIKAQAVEYKAEAMSIDNELGSIYFKPNYDGFKRS